jgi:hypothetical protein
MIIQFIVRNSEFRAQTKNLKFCFLTFIVTFFALGFTPAYGQTVSSTELINNAKLYDGKVVVYEGEVIGDIMKRGDYAWINVNDGDKAVGIWVNYSLTKEINYTGSYKSKGDRIEITGVFQRACVQHGGDLDIHAQGIRKLSPGRAIQEKLNPGKRNLAITSLGFLCLIWILVLLKRK